MHGKWGNGYGGKTGPGKLYEAKANSAVSPLLSGTPYGKGHQVKDEPSVYGESGGDESHSNVFWLKLANESRLAKCGLPPDAPVIEYNKSIPFLPHAKSILEDIIGEYAWEVMFEHDINWDNFPEVGAALKAAGGPEECLCVATCPNHSFWGVGVASGWRNRETVSRLALCVALAVQLGAVDALNGRYPGFGSFCNFRPCADPNAGANAAQIRAGCGNAYQTATAGASEWSFKGHVDPTTSSQYVPTSTPVPIWIKLKRASRLIDMGYGAEAPTISYDKSFSVFRDAHNMLAELLGDVASEVTFHHDPDWLEFPEVAEAMCTAGADEICLTVIVCPKACKWAVGIGHGWKNRETAAKFALCIALESSSSEGNGSNTSLKNSMVNSASQYDNQMCPVSKRRRVQEQSEIVAPEERPQIGDETSQPPLPQDKPVWIQLPEPPSGATQPELFGLPTETIAVCAGARFRKKSLYNSIDDVLACFTPEPDTDIEYHDDSDWTLFPEVVAALRQHGNPDGFCLHIAIHRARGAWGVGLCSNWRGRCQGAKVALAAVLALQAPGDIVLSNFPGFSNFIEDLRAVP